MNDALHRSVRAKGSGVNGSISHNGRRQATVQRTEALLPDHGSEAVHHATVNTWTGLQPHLD